MINSFFQRPHSSNFNYYLLQMYKIINENNIIYLTKRKIRNYFIINQEKDFLAFRFFIFRKWMVRNEKYTFQYLKKLKKVIATLFLSNEFNSYEKQYIFDLEAIIFAKIRNLKPLIVDFPLIKNENVFFKFNNVHFSSTQQLLTINKYYCFISNFRIIIMKNFDLINLYFKNIQQFIFNHDKIVFIMNNFTNYILNYKNNYVFYACLERMLKLEHI